MSILQITILSILIIFAVIQCMYINKRRVILKRDKALTSSGVGPYGSGLCHGMVLHPEGDGKRVKRDSGKSAAWYSRLV